MLDFLPFRFWFDFLCKPMNDFIRCLAITRQNRLRPYRERTTRSSTQPAATMQDQSVQQRDDEFIVLASGTSVHLV